MAYQHGIQVNEAATKIITPITGTAGLQVIFGTAPVHLAADPKKAANELYMFTNFKEAAETLGYSDDFEKYTLCGSMYVSLSQKGIAPIILCNVLDPTIHKKELEEKSYPIKEGQVIIPEDGILLYSLVVKNGDVMLQKEVDYTIAFNQDEFAVITFLEDGLTEVMVSGDKIDPDAITAADIIGGFDIVTGKETGLELVRQVYPKFGMTPGLLLAPKWSCDPGVAVMMSSKCELINGCFRCECVVDIDTEKVRKYSDILEYKNKNGIVGEHMVGVWPMLKLGDALLYYSSVYAASVAYQDVQNDDIPCLTMSNKLLGVTGSILKDGTEVNLDQIQANIINAAGIITVINANGYRAWGSNTTAYPGTTDPKDRWINCRRFFSWWGNSFILTYFQKVDDPLNKVLIESIVDSENIRGNSYVATGKCAGARIEYRAEENPITQILDGQLVFHQYLAPYPPAEFIKNTLEFDTDALEAALS